MTRSASRIDRLSAAGLLVLLAVASLPGLTVAQTAPAPPPEQQPAGSPPEKTDNPGLINELGKLFKKPVDLFPSLKATPDTPGSASGASPPGDTVIVEPSQPAAPAPAAPPPAAATPAAPAPSPPPAAPPATTATPATPGLIPKMVTGRAVCPVAANGAPDCKAGADALCKSKGMTSGRSLDMDSAHNCSTQNILSGARSIKDICRTETFVTRAMCQ